MNGSTEYYNESELHGVFYWINNSAITYVGFCINLFIIIFHIGIIILNSLMIEALRRSRKVDEPAGHCLILLSVSYIWLSFMMIYTGIYGLANMQDKDECLMRFGLVHSALMNVSWANVLISIDRYLQVEFPFAYKRAVQIKMVWMASTSTFAAILIYSLSPWIFDWYWSPAKDGRQNICEYFDILPAPYLQGFCIISFSGFVVIVIIYSRLLFIAKRHKAVIQKLRKTSTASTDFPKESRRQWRGIKMAVIIAGVFLMSWGPPGIFLLYVTSLPSYPKSTVQFSSVVAGLSIIPSISGIINPSMFTLNSQVKKHFLKIIGRQRSLQKLREKMWRSKIAVVEFSETSLYESNDTHISCIN